ncbi:hypothetical protein JK359_29780 [Streptomyces actinomycinicus]|uniref:Uncharacterized protein n=1 Tax=Streptomyces actinomycinicus TaxID=1695166 RepID=A0A937EMM5_9ACTN|nr:hypothetical protein [Streptomyces actinomycinicus]MBL1086103.1 hypothetical protein [Streptomyces actinomycinicus]
MSARPEPSLSAPTAPVSRLGLYDTWWTVAAAALGVCLGLTACAWISLHLHVDDTLHTAALFVHLASLVLGFGAVLSADYHALLWLTGRCTLTDAMAGTSRLHVPIWAGLAGLVASGALLQPDLGSALTRTKLALVLALTLNGLQAGLLTRRMRARRDGTVPPRLLLWGAGTALVSQVCWWGAVVIGFRNSQG